MGLPIRATRAQRRGAKKLVSSAAALLGQQAAGDLGVPVEARLAEHVEHAAGGAGLRVGRAVDDARHPRPHDRARAHRAGLDRHVQDGVGDPPAAELRAGLAQRQHLGVRGRVRRAARARCRRPPAPRRRARPPRRSARRRARAPARPRAARAACSTRRAGRSGRACGLAQITVLRPASRPASLQRQQQPKPVADAHPGASSGRTSCGLRPADAAVLDQLEVPVDGARRASRSAGRGS